MERFLAELPPEVIAVPMAGGASARNGAEGDTWPIAEDAAVFAIQEGQWKAVTVVGHHPVGPSVRCAASDPRRFGTVEAEGRQIAALDFFAASGTSVGSPKMIGIGSR